MSRLLYLLLVIGYKIAAGMILRCLQKGIAVVIVVEVILKEGCYRVLVRRTWDLRKL